MAETRIDKDIPIFGENALTGEIKEFGTTTDSTDINELLSTTEAGRGWFFLGTTDFPTKEQFNAVGYSLTKFIKYLYERGIAEWNTNVNYPIGGWVIASNGRPYRALTANSGNDPIGDTTNWEQPVLFQEKDKNITHDITVDSDYTLTDDQNLYGRINITDTGVVLTTARNIIVDNVEKNSFIFENSTAQDLTVKTSAGTGILVTTGETKILRNDGTNVLESDLSGRDDGFGVNQTWQNVTSSRSLGVTYTNTTGKPIMVYIFFRDSDDNGTPTSFLIDGVQFVSSGGSGMKNTMLSFIVPNGNTYSIQTTNASFYNWNELR
jgi:hypothetical protein